MKTHASRFAPSARKLLAVIPAIACASQAGAAVVYTDLGSGLTAPLNTPIYFNLDGTLASTSYDSSYQYSFVLNAKSGPLAFTGNNGGSFVTNSFNTVTGGDLIDGSLSFDDSISMATTETPVYIGLELVDGANTYYGWAEVEDLIDSGGEASLLGFAYDDTGAGIRAGATTSAVPEPAATAAFAGLAAGAVAAFAARRKRKAAALAT